MSVALRIGQADGAGIVDADVDAAEFGDGLLDRLHHLRFVADVAQHRQRLAAGGAHLVGRGVDGALQSRMRLGGLGRDRDIGAVTRGAQCNGEPDAAAGAGYEQRLAFERCHDERLLLGTHGPTAPPQGGTTEQASSLCPHQANRQSRGILTAPPPPRRVCADRARRAGRAGVTAIELAEVWPSGSITLCPFCRSAASISGGNAAFDAHVIRHPLMVHARRGHRGGDIHLVVDHVDDHLRHRRNDAAAAGCARDQHRLAVLQHDGRRHRRQRAFSGTGQIGLEADQAEGVGRRRAPR